MGGVVQLICYSTTGCVHCNMCSVGLVTVCFFLVRFRVLVVVVISIRGIILVSGISCIVCL